MKQMIIMLAMLLLGIAIYNLIAGEGQGSLLHTMGGIWQEEIRIRSSYP